MNDFERWREQLALNMIGDRSLTGEELRTGWALWLDINRQTRVAHPGLERLQARTGQQDKRNLQRAIKGLDEKGHFKPLSGGKGRGDTSNYVPAHLDDERASPATPLDDERASPKTPFEEGKGVTHDTVRASPVTRKGRHPRRPTLERPLKETQGRKRRGNNTAAPTIPIPPDFQPSAKSIAQAEAKGWEQTRIENLRLRFIAYYEANAETCENWDAKFRGWIHKEREEKQSNRKPGRTSMVHAALREGGFDV